MELKSCFLGGHAPTKKLLKNRERWSATFRSAGALAPCVLSERFCNHLKMLAFSSEENIDLPKRRN